MRFKRTLFSVAVALGASVVMATGVAQAAPQTISQAGSSLVYPLVTEWATNFNIYTGNTVNTASVGSGAGIADVCAPSQSAQIGASDAPLGFPGVAACRSNSSADIAQFVEVPWALSATEFSYVIKLANGKYLKNGLRVSAQDLAKIYTGKITKWSQLQHEQYKIVKRHKRVKRHGKYVRITVKKKKKLWTLPNTTIDPVYRSDGSGDSFAFTNFLTRGAGKTLWPSGPSTSFPTGVGVGGHGNSGVLAAILADKNHSSGGYISLYYLISAQAQNPQLGVAAVKNAAGRYILPSLKAIDAAAASVSAPPAQNKASTKSGHYFGMNIQYPPKKYKNAFPLSTYTYAIVKKSGNANAGALRSFLYYAIGTNFHGHPGGRGVGTAIGFAPLSAQVQQYCKNVIKTIS